MNPLDQILMPVLNAGAGNALFDRVMPRITNLHQMGLFWLAVVLVAIWIFARGSKRAKVGLICAVLAVGLSDATAKRIVKNVVHRQRPCQMIMGARAYPDVRLAPGQNCPGSPSLPSNHAANMMALASVGWWFSRGRARWLWLLLPLVIGYSRIYLGFHYPTDVLAGWLLGFALASAVIAVAHRWYPVSDSSLAPPPSEEEPAV